MASEAESRSEASIVLFGGTFDPPHNGHRLMLQQARQLLPRAKLWILPALMPAGSQQQHKQPQASFQQRLEMCELAFAEELSQGIVSILDLEKNLPVPNFTIRTLQYCQHTYPDERWAFLIGQDQLQGFSAWYEAKLILEQADLIVVGRGNVGSLSETAYSLAKTLDLTLTKLAENSYTWLNKQRLLYLLAGRVSEAASTHIRTHPLQALQKGWLVPAVVAYMQQARLYGQ